MSRLRFLNFSFQILNRTYLTLFRERTKSINVEQFNSRRKLPRSSCLVINLALSDFLLLLNMPLEIINTTVEKLDSNLLQTNFLCKGPIHYHYFTMLSFYRRTVLDGKDTSYYESYHESYHESYYESY